jgi:hypothetical protein
MTNFTTLDITGALTACLGFCAILLAPGYLVASAFKVAGFRTRNWLERTAWSIALSFAVSPILINLLARFVSLGALAGLFGIALAGTLLRLIQDRHLLQFRWSRTTLALAMVLLFGTAVVIGELIDIQSGNRLSLSVTLLDQAFRVPFINSLAHAGFPPQNPIYHPGLVSPLRYYYFWYAVCAVVMKLAHISARQALIASSVWAAIGLVALIALFARHFLGLRKGLYRYMVVASLLLMVTGLDILPVFYNLIEDHEFSGDIEWWSTDQVTSWLDSILWVPHHVASLLCCLTCFLLLWKLREPASRLERWVAISLAGAAAASAFGLSVYVTAGFAALMMAWAILLLVRERNPRLAASGLASAVIACSLLLPFLQDLMQSQSGTQAGSASAGKHLFSFGIRNMIDSALVTGLPALASIHAHHPMLLDQSVRLFLLIPGYGTELGVFGLILVLALFKWRHFDHAHRTALFLTLGGLVLITFVRSSVIGNNDFGYRAAMLPCFFLLLLTAEWFCRPAPRRHAAWVYLFLVLGVAGTGFQALMLRIYIPLHVAARAPGFTTLPDDAFEARSGYARAASLLPPTAVVQFNLRDPSDYGYLANMVYSERAMATDSADDCGSVFGGDISRCAQTKQAIRELFATPAPSARQAVNVCKKLGIDFLAVAKNDAAWEDSHSWVWSLPPVPNPAASANGSGEQSNPRFRIVNCRDPSPSMP